MPCWRMTEWSWPKICGGGVITRWDGKTTKPHPVTGEQVPDEAAQVPVWHYVNPRPAAWPTAKFIVGNPPFIGASAMRGALGDGYVEALRKAWPDVPDSADFVMTWWHCAALAVARGSAEQFGFITTNSLRQTFNRRVIEQHLDAGPGQLSLAFAVPDHPWVDGAQGAAVRIAMTVASRRAEAGRLALVVREHPGPAEEVAVVLSETRGQLHADLRVGANVASAGQLRANLAISSPGVKLHGSGFIVTPDEARGLGLESDHVPGQFIREYRNGRDLTSRPRGVMVIDLFGLGVDAVRQRVPTIYQWLLDRVKPERDQNNRASYRENWWLFGEPRKDLRPMLQCLSRYVATVETSKHRVFQFLGVEVLPDNMLIAIATADALLLGVLSSQIHVDWALAAGGRLGVGNDPRYNKTRCFETFPFPSDDTGLTPELSDKIRGLAEQLDAHRKARQAAHEAVTLTGMYNVLDKLRRGEALTAKDKLMHEQALVSVLQSLHDELDAAVLQAYGWQDLGPVPWADEAARATWTETLLERLVALNAKRAAEEAAGTVRWLRPEFQDPARRAPATAASDGTQAEIDGLPAADEPADADSSPDASEATGVPAAATITRQPWPADLPAQVKAVADVLQASPGALTEAALAERFSGRGPWKKRLPQILGTLEAVGRARATAQGWRA